MGGKMKHEELSVAQEIMVEFADLTGLLPEQEVPRRYLWTDAFAVCNFLELYRQTRDEQYRKLALLLVDQVHRTLGRHRDDDPRTGWISGLDEQAGRLHPTAGGLRIGKPLNERSPDDPYDDLLEWDRDGQYYHYLTKWMHALNRMSAVTGDPACHSWAVELAKAAHAGFTHDRQMIFWKMSIDLSYPLVPAMGQHDPLDGFITYHELQAGSARDCKGPTHHDLALEIADMARICSGKDWTTDDPLGIGGLLSDAYRVAQLTVSGAFEQPELLGSVLDAAHLGLNAWVRADLLKAPASHRLAFRELGLSIGLHAVERLKRLTGSKPEIFDKEPRLLKQLESLMPYVPLGETIENFWLEPKHREGSSFIEHRDINMVMLVASLIPDGFLSV
jgi:hypothetical protein